MMENFKIVTDSSADILSLGEIPYSAAPLKIVTAQKEYVDDSSLSVKDMVDALAAYEGSSSTSCPNAWDWLNAFGDSSYVFCITMTAALSGGYHAAMIAKAEYEAAHPDRRVFVFNSLTTGPEMKLIVERICELIAEGQTFEQICRAIKEYKAGTGLLFVLESMKNLSSNGRVSALAAKAAGLLGIRVLGRAGAGGDLQLLDKCRGADRTISAIICRMKEQGWKNGKVRIAHCMNEDAAIKLKHRLQKERKHVRIEVYHCRGLCSFYAEKGGMLIGFERC